MKSYTKKKNAFTLIELLSVIIILGILMLIAVPSVTEYITSSRKNAFVTTAAAYITAVRNKVNQGEELKLYDENVFYFVQVGPNKDNSIVFLEKGGSSPFNNTWDYAYVGVVYSGSGFSYYFMGKDASGQEIELISEDDLLREKKDRVSLTETDFKAMYNLQGKITYTIPYVGIIFDKVTEASQRAYSTVLVINKGEGEYIAANGELDDGCSNCSTLGAGNAKYSWLFDRISNCEAYGCNIQMASYKSYWTSSSETGTNSKAWMVTSWGRLETADVTATSTAGVRPVITVPRYLLQL